MTRTRDDMKQQMAFMNNPVERKIAAELADIRKLETGDAERPISQGSSLALEIKEQKQEADDLAIALAVEEDAENTDEAKTNPPVEKTKTRPIPELKEEESTNVKHVIDKVGKNIIVAQIEPHFSDDIGAFAGLAGSCKAFHTLFQPILTPAKTKIQPQLKELAQHVVYGEMDELDLKLKTIMETQPKLLKELLKARTQVKDYSGRIIEGTFLQLAFGADDVSRKEFPDEGMAEMIMKYLRATLKEKAELEIKNQYREQFPAGNEKEENAQHERDVVALKKVVAAIAEAKVEVVKNSKTIPDKKCEQALEEFRTYLKPKGVIKKGRHFNIKLLVEAFKLFDEKFDDFGGNGNSPRNMLFWQKVIGYIQTFLPACYAQVFCQSFSEIIDGTLYGTKEKLVRSLSFQYGRGTFYPYHSNLSTYLLGFDWAAGKSGSGQFYANWSGTLADKLKTYAEQKQQRYEDLCPCNATTQRLGAGA